MPDEFKTEHAWAVRGIPEDIRKAVVERARTEGRTVGAWVADALRRSLATEGMAEQMARLQQRIEALERKLASGE